MKKYLNGILVVEGKEDEAYLSSFLDTEFVKTNGYQIPQKEIEFLKEAGKTLVIYVLTDPDEAGRNIADKLKNLVPNCVLLNADIAKCTRGDKNGIAECQKEEILKILEPYLSNEPIDKGDITLSDLSHLSKEEKEYLCDKLSLGLCNNKKMIRRLNLFKIKREDINRLITEYQNGNQ
ncbi:MAG: DUF4093 domain-containing protein [Bacilli bacterium]|nr:DUF4093 domain-containing protein [Bacilli bacterium]